MVTSSIRLGWIAVVVVLALAFAPSPARAKGASRDSTAVPFPAASVRRWQSGVLRADRLQHASLTMTLGLAAGLITRKTGVATCTGLGLGLAKELYDMRRGGSGFDATDLLADGLGTGVAVIGVSRVADH
jgi:uncharacterized protein YfiM (DUF2279 family)